MVETGQRAPDFTVPLANGEVDQFTLSERLEEAPIVLAFFPGAFTSTCTHEMNTFQDSLEEFEAAGATVYGISVDSPFALNEFRDQLGLTFDLLSDFEREVIEAYDVAVDLSHDGVNDVADRAVVVIDANREVTYAWVGANPGVEPDYDEVLSAVGG